MSDTFAQQNNLALSLAGLTAPAVPSVEILQATKLMYDNDKEMNGGKNAAAIKALYQNSTRSVNAAITLVAENERLQEKVGDDISAAFTIAPALNQFSAQKQLERLFDAENRLPAKGSMAAAIAQNGRIHRLGATSASASGP